MLLTEQITMVLISNQKMYFINSQRLEYRFCLEPLKNNMETIH